ncbi:MAG: histidine phosphatase family protein [Polyangiales bacterium]
MSDETRSGAPAIPGESAAPVRVTFVRHGESESNSAGRWQGQTDSPLSEHGHAQARKAGVRLGRVPFDLVISSDLTRAHDTARASGHPVETDPRFREIHVGRWEGLTRAEVLERFPEEIAAIFRGEDIRIGGGESWADATERADSALSTLKERLRPGQHAAVFSHGGVITSLFLRFVGVSRRRPQPLGHMVNTAISTVRFEHGHPIVERYNDATHTAPEGPWTRKMFGAEDAIVALLAWDEDGGRAPIEHEAFGRVFADVARVYAGADGDTHAVAEALAARLGVPFAGDRASLEAVEELAAAHAGERVLVVAPCAQIHATATMVVRRLGQDARFAPPEPGTVTHVARTKSVVLVADYNAGPLHDLG